MGSNFPLLLFSSHPWVHLSFIFLQQSNSSFQIKDGPQVDVLCFAWCKGNNTHPTKYAKILNTNTVISNCLIPAKNTAPVRSPVCSWAGSVSPVLIATRNIDNWRYLPEMENKRSASYNEYPAAQSTQWAWKKWPRFCLCQWLCPKSLP